MPQINLIQEQRLAVRHQERQVRVVLMAICGIGVVSFLTAGYFTFETVRYTLRMGDLQNQKKKLEPIMKTVQENEDLIASLNVRTQTLESADKDTSRWTAILTHLSSNTPDGVFLSDFKSSQSDPKSGISLGLTGMSIDQNRVGQFIMRLEAAKDLEGVALRYTQEKVGPNNRSTQFELAASVAGTAPKETEATEKKDDQAVKS